MLKVRKSLLLKSVRKCRVTHPHWTTSHTHTNTNSLQATVKAINKLHKIKQTKSNYENERGSMANFY